MRMLACAALPAWRLLRAAFYTRNFVRARRNRLLRTAPCDVPLVAQGPYKLHQHMAETRVGARFVCPFRANFGARMSSGKWPMCLQNLRKRLVLFAKFTFFG